MRSKMMMRFIISDKQCGKLFNKVLDDYGKVTSITLGADKK